MKVRVLSWNINSVRLRIDSLLSIIKEYRPNVVCIQETKCPNDQYPYEEFHKVGLKNVHSNGIKGYHGVSIATDLDVKKVEQKNLSGTTDVNNFPNEQKRKEEVPAFLRRQAN